MPLGISRSILHAPPRTQHPTPPTPHSTPSTSNHPQHQGAAKASRLRNVIPTTQTQPSPRDQRSSIIEYMNRLPTPPAVRRTPSPLATTAEEISPHARQEEETIQPPVAQANANPSPAAEVVADLSPEPAMQEENVSLPLIGQADANPSTREEVVAQLPTAIAATVTAVADHALSQATEDSTLSPGSSLKSSLELTPLLIPKDHSPITDDLFSSPLSPISPNAPGWFSSPTSDAPKASFSSPLLNEPDVPSFDQEALSLSTDGLSSQKAEESTPTEPIEKLPEYLIWLQDQSEANNQIDLFGAILQALSTSTNRPSNPQDSAFQLIRQFPQFKYEIGPQSSVADQFNLLRMVREINENGHFQLFATIFNSLAKSDSNNFEAFQQAFNITCSFPPFSASVASPVLTPESTITFTEESMPFKNALPNWTNWIETRAKNHHLKLYETTYKALMRENEDNISNGTITQEKIQQQAAEIVSSFPPLAADPNCDLILEEDLNKMLKTLKDQNHFQLFATIFNALIASNSDNPPEQPNDFAQAFAITRLFPPNVTIEQVQQPSNKDDPITFKISSNAAQSYGSCSSDDSSSSFVINYPETCTVSIHQNKVTFNPTIPWTVSATVKNPIHDFKVSTDIQLKSLTIEPLPKYSVVNGFKDQEILPEIESGTTFNIIRKIFFGANSLELDLPTIHDYSEDTEWGPPRENKK